MISVNLHNVDRMEATNGKTAGWLEIFDNRGNHVTVFMPYPLAEHIAEVFDNYDEQCDECHRERKWDGGPWCRACLAEKGEAERSAFETGEDDRAHAWADQERGL